MCRDTYAPPITKSGHDRDDGRSFQLMDAQVAHDLLDPAFRQVAVAAVQLQRAFRNLEPDIGREALGDGASRVVC